MVCAYQPCLPSGINNVFSVYAQHGRFFDLKKDDICPRQAFVRDIGKELDTWLHMGDQIVIALDANEDMRLGPVSEAFRKRGLREAIMERHGRNVPAMTDCGTDAIDGIWASKTITILCRGYLACGDLIPRTNHRALWMDVRYRVLYGHISPPIARAQARRLKLQDPRIVQQFNDKYRQLIMQYKLNERAFDLEKRSSYPPTQDMVEAYENLDSDKIVCVRIADKACRKLKMGGVPWSVGLQQARDVLGTWQLLMKKVVGRKVSSNLIQRKAKAAGLRRIFVREITYEVAVLEERKAYKEYMKLKAGSKMQEKRF